MQHLRPLGQARPEENGHAHGSPPTERAAAQWIGRATAAIAALFLLIGLATWLVRQGEHYRLVLAFLTVAMFAAILHAYTYEIGEG